MLFSEHGEFTLSQDGNIIVFVAKGSWNNECSTRCIEQTRQILEQLPHETFAFVVDTSNVEGMTPDAFASWEIAIERLTARGHKATTRIDDPQSPYYQLFVKSFDDHFKKHMPFKFSSTVEEGIAWLHQLGFHGFE